MFHNKNDQQVGYFSTGVSVTKQQGERMTLKTGTGFIISAVVGLTISLAFGLILCYLVFTGLSFI